MKKQSEFFTEEELHKSCPAILEEDVTKSVNERVEVLSRSQQIKVTQKGEAFQDMSQKEREVVKKEMKKNFGIEEKPEVEKKAEINIIQVRNKGTDFDCQKVQSVQLSCQGQSQRSRSRRNGSQNEIEQPTSAKKSRKSHNPKRQAQLEQKEATRSHVRQKRPINELQHQQLNILVAGAQDTGKSMFIRCFLHKPRKRDQQLIKQRTKQLRQQVGINSDNPSFPNKPQVSFIDIGGFAPGQQSKYVKQIQAEAIERWQRFDTGRKSLTKKDPRIHCCLYFMRGPRIKQPDIKVMKTLALMFNLIPVIAKSDQYTLQEITQIKEEFHRRIIVEERVQLYDIEEVLRLKYGTENIKEKMQTRFGRFPPFVVVGAFEEEKGEGEKGFVRIYPWGKVEIANEQHSDFVRLKTLLTEELKGELIAKVIRVAEKDESVEEFEGVLGNRIERLQNQQNKPKEQFWTKFARGTVLIGVVVCILAYKYKAKH